MKWAYKYSRGEKVCAQFLWGICTDKLEEEMG